MKNQVTSIGQSKRLIELGVPAEKASMVWHRMFRDKKTGYTEWALKIGPIQKFPQLEVLQIIPAFTVADLMGLLPSVIFIAIRFNPTLEKTGEDGWDFEFGQISQDEEYGFARNKSLIDLLVGRIEWVMSNGYKLNI
jgi:hypothetical protein